MDLIQSNKKYNGFHYNVPVPHTHTHTHKHTLTHTQTHTLYHGEPFWLQWFQLDIFRAMNEGQHF